jgi:hypothetical protein
LAQAYTKSAAIQPPGADENCRGELNHPRAFTRRAGAHHLVQVARPLPQGVCAGRGAAAGFPARNPLNTVLLTKNVLARPVAHTLLFIKAVVVAPL